MFRSLKSFLIAHCSRPAWERCIYRTIRQQSVATIVELGLGVGIRAGRMIQLAQIAGQSVRYTGIDEFESRSADAAPGLSLKQAYQQLRKTGAAIQLVPGDPLAALTRAANSLTRTDLLVISADVDGQALRRAWWYVPRMLHRKSTVYLEECHDGRRYFVRLAMGEVNRLAESQATYLRRAA